MYSSNEESVKSIGIHLGANNARVAVFRNGKAEVVEDEYGNRCIPCFVAFTENEILVGQEAKECMSEDAKNVVFDCIYLIGKQYTDADISSRMSCWPFKVQPAFEVMYENEVRNFSATQISAFIIKKMKDIAEEYLNYQVSDAVITVPAWFKDDQRNATKEAGLLAGFKDIQLLNEPTAAAIAYGFGNDASRANILVYHLRSTSFDVTILEAKKGKFDIKWTYSYMDIGGNIIDDILVDHFSREFKSKRNIDLTRNKEALQRLRDACRVAKHQLSDEIKAEVTVDAIANGVDLKSTILRYTFDNICRGYLDLTLDHVKQALNNAALTANGINEVILIGQSAKIPKIISTLRTLLGKDKLNLSIKENEAVVIGAAIRAANNARNVTESVN